MEIIKKISSKYLTLYSDFKIFQFNYFWIKIIRYPSDLSVPHAANHTLLKGKNQEVMVMARWVTVKQVN
jgi:hypothetical protein